MLAVLFDLDGDRYALDARQVVEVLPRIRIKQIPQAPRGVAGVMNYRGAPVPVIDLTALILGRPSQACLSTRLIIAHYSAGEGPTRVIGLIAEHATEMMRRPDRNFVTAGIAVDAAPYLGRMATGPDGVVQLVDVSRLLPPPVDGHLFRQVAEG